MFSGCNVIEIGGGRTCLAGVCIAANCDAASVVLTDGNEKCVQNIKDIICKNRPNMLCSSVTSSVVRWDNQATFEQHQSKFDYLLAADCLFFEDVQLQLVQAILYLLKPGGQALLFAPHRGDTLKTFVALCEDKFSKISLSEPSQYSKIVENYHKSALSSNQLYNPNLHKPILLILQK